MNLTNDQIAKSLHTLYYQRMGNSIFGIVGTMGIVTNTLVILCILNWKPLRNKAQIGIFSLAVSDIITSTACIYLGMWRLYCDLSGTPMVMFMSQCRPYIYYNMVGNLIAQY